MVGQLFDEIFIYLQNITSKANNDNRLDYGVSKDLIPSSSLYDIAESVEKS